MPWRGSLKPPAEPMIKPYGCDREIKEIFETTIVKWFQESAQKWDRKEPFGAIWNEDAGTVVEEITRLLRKDWQYPVRKRLGR